MGDQLFPFPEPTFIFVHDIIILPLSLMVVEIGERGNQHTHLPDVADYPAPVKGYLTAPNERRDLMTAVERQEISAVCLLPRDTIIDYSDYIYSNDPQLPPHLAGAYSIDSVRATISHLRVLLRRYRGQWELTQAEVVPPPEEP